MVYFRSGSYNYRLRMCSWLWQQIIRPLILRNCGPAADCLFSRSVHLRKQTVHCWQYAVAVWRPELLSGRAIRDRLAAFGHSSTARLEPPGPCRPRYQSTVAWHAAAYGVGGNARAGSEVDARNQGCADLDKFWSATSPQSASPRTKVHRVYPVMQRRQRPLF